MESTPIDEQQASLDNLLGDRDDDRDAENTLGYEENTPSLFRNEQTESLELDRLLSNFLNESDPTKRMSLYQQFLRKKEEYNQQEFENRELFGDILYPHQDDSNFAIKLAKKKEFFDTVQEDQLYNPETKGDELANTEFELSPHQQFVRTFLSKQTPYNSLLLFHGLGTGKTCSAISVCEEMRDYMRQTGNKRRIVIVASPNVQTNFRTQLFDHRKLKKVNGTWTLKACTGNKFLREINPMNIKGLTKTTIVKQVDKLIRQSYVFMGYQKFGNYIEKLIQEATRNIDDKDRIKRRKKRIIQQEFSNRMIVIDEVHNIRISEDNPNKQVANMLLEIVNYTDSMKLLLLSATPMFNNYREILWLLNLMNMNDKRSRIRPRDVFTKDGQFVEKDGIQVGRQLLLDKSRGYISYVRGENPYTFPYRIFPSLFQPEKTFREIIQPTYQVNGRRIRQEEQLNHIDVYLQELDSYQEKGYNYILDEIKESFPSFSDIEKGLGYQALNSPLQALNIVYPSRTLDKYLRRGKGNRPEIRELVGRRGLAQIMDFKSNKTEYEYKDEVLERYGRIFQQDRIGKYSSKLEGIIDNLYRSKSPEGQGGIILIYSEYIDGGCVPVALALEEMGFRRYKGNPSLLKEPGKPIDSLTLKPENEFDEEKEGRRFRQASYVMITGDQELSPQGSNEREVNASTSVLNDYGEEVRVIIVSKAGSEGLDFRLVRQVHIIDPWFNMNRIEQIVGRAVRTFSHITLPFHERNVQIFLYASLLSKTPEIEAVDLYVYRLAERKAVQIGKITRLLKENAVDCRLNYPTTSGFTVDEFDKEVDLTLSTGDVVQYKIGDKPYTATCDYMESCAYRCLPHMIQGYDMDIMDIHRKERKLIQDSQNVDTYNEEFILKNTDKLKRVIGKIIGTHYVISKKNLLKEISKESTYPLTQIYASLQQLIEDEHEHITEKNGRIGHVVNIDQYYAFQPIEIQNRGIPYSQRARPLDVKFDDVHIRVPTEIKDKLYPELEESESKDDESFTLLETLAEKLVLVSRTQTVKRAEKDWYILASIMIDRLSDDSDNGSKQSAIPTINRNYLLYYVVCHFIEKLWSSQRLELFNTPKPREDTLMFAYQMVQEYIRENRIESNDGTLHAMYLFDENQKDHLYIQEKNWEEAKPMESRKFSKQLSTLKIPLDQFSKFVGFMILFKDKEYVFKVKRLELKRNKGARCDQASKNVILNLMNEIMKYKYDEDNVYTTKNMKNISKLQVCIEQEFLIRYFNDTTDEIWYLNTALAYANKIETIHRE